MSAVNLASTFAELLEPLGLDEQCCEAFSEADLLFQVRHNAAVRTVASIATPNTKYQRQFECIVGHTYDMYACSNPASWRHVLCHGAGSERCDKGGPG